MHFFLHIKNIILHYTLHKAKIKVYKIVKSNMYSDNNINIATYTLMNNIITYH